MLRYVEWFYETFVGGRVYEDVTTRVADAPTVGWAVLWSIINSLPDALRFFLW